MKGVVIFGATGSIGTQTLDLIKSNSDYQLLGFTFNRNIEGAIKIINELHPLIVGVTNSETKMKLQNMKLNIEVVDANNPARILEYHYPKMEILFINAVTGSAGLRPTYEIIKHHHNVLLANKESLVMAGEIIMNLACENNVKVIPIDSEHSGLLKIIHGKHHTEIENLIITASGGALRDVPVDKLVDVTKEDALRHPNWLMGQDITINCATMMNKGYEVIEACHLFNVPLQSVKVLVHRESVVHALVEFIDGSIEANLGTSDMHIPIQYAMTYPKQTKYCGSKLNLAQINTLHFEELDLNRYPCFSLAIAAFARGGFYPTILNAANEQAVKLFLNDQIGYLDIAKIVEDMLNQYDELAKNIKEFTIEEILKLDKIVKDQIELKKGSVQKWENG